MNEPLEPLEYHRLQRAAPWAPWRPLVGVVTLSVVFVVLAPVVSLAAFTVGLGISGADVTSSVERMLDTDHVTPLGLAYLNVAIALMIPATWLVAWALHRQRPGWLASVAPRIRWRWLLICLGLAFLALLVTLMVAAVVPASEDAGEVSTQLNGWTTTTRDFVLVVLLLTPLQAAGEEYVFRGYLTQAFGGLVRSRWLAVVGPALLFALAHGAQDPQIFVDRFAFGLVAGILVILTGGLEAGIAMHVLNNFFAFGLALAFGDITTVLNPTGGSWWSLATTLTQSVSFLVLSVGAARLLGLRTVAKPPVLAPSDTRV
ncbi:CPBP family intramembrane glutamic endopeptidase [Nocardioides sp. zg-DK7169]|uniref:CPBP family intramembrane glutamic endopeptidase n=1 Tax=Nocardioides sp. zg-DK7169 TaxID=2736600 RepID=UPI001555E141|nr:type II CAAX endopeptidase family protein [Nocardioides sp. zg-DK7169]NPC95598.1 CPBP family intramembrane metalloprotease [Nocardioides sp. zg-DK7169]